MNQTPLPKSDLDQKKPDQQELKVPDKVIIGRDMKDERFNNTFEIRTLDNGQEVLLYTVRSLTNSAANAWLDHIKQEYMSRNHVLVIYDMGNLLPLSHVLTRSGEVTNANPNIVGAVVIVNTNRLIKSLLERFVTTHSSPLTGMVELQKGLAYQYCPSIEAALEWLGKVAKE